MMQSKHGFQKDCFGPNVPPRCRDGWNSPRALARSAWEHVQIRVHPATRRKNAQHQPRSMAYFTTPAAFFTSSLLMMFLRCVSTVWALMKSFSAISCVLNSMQIN